MFGDLAHFGDLLRRHARYSGQRIGIVYGDVRLTWQQLNARANRFASALQQRGVRKGDRVAILSRNCHEYVEILFGLAKIGVISVPINYRLAEPEIEFICNDSGAVFLIAGPEYVSVADRIASRSKHIKEIIAFGQASPKHCTSYNSLIEAGREAEPVPDRSIEPDDLLLFLYTSGTTGFPKGVMYTHYGTLVGMFVHVLAIGSHSSHRVMLPAPLYSAAGIAGIFCAVYVGSYIVLINFEPEQALETIQKERITFTNLVPTTIQMLATREDIDRYDLSSLKVLLYGGAPMPEPILRRAADVFRCDFRQTYATSETGCSGTVLEPHEHRLALSDERSRKLLSSCGRPQCNVGVRVVDANGVDVAVGEVGEICIYTEGNMVGYWNNPTATAEVLRDGWVYTGDLATVDEDGYLYLVDRKHDMIVSGGLNVYPSEVERVLYQHPAVFECAVIGVPHDVWGEAVKAVVVVKEGATLTEQELIAFGKEKLAGYKCPKSVDFVERLPRNLTGKVLRRVLREPYWEGRSRKI
jgi:acyl-CoA synthetase (AMP-forming)/AMP-acid ligase II